jgi:hypothetical protein
MKKSIIVIILFLILCVASAQPFIPGTSYFGRGNYIEYIPGTLPVIITVPHGGSLTPGEIPDRTCGDETVTDSYTINLARSIQEEMTEVTGCYPHVIICHLKRTKLDANRDLASAACGNEFAETAWNEFHLFIDSAKASVVKKSGKGLLIDLHGHGHSIQRLELGYLLNGAQLAYSDPVLNTAAYINLSSIRNLVGSNVNNLQHSELLHGMHSLGTMFAARGYQSVPSIDEPFPFTGEPYFGGGYNTERHGSVKSGTVDAIQIECNQNVRFEETARNSFAAATAAVFLNYLIKHYFPSLTQAYCKPVDIESTDNDGFALYPVPFTETLSVRSLVPCQINIYNFKGELMFIKEIGPEECLDLRHLKNGLYLVTLSDEGKILFREKIIKKSTK